MIRGIRSRREQMVIAALDVACFVQPSPMPWGPIVPFEASLCGWPKADCRPSFVVFGLKLGLLDRLLRCPIIKFCWSAYPRSWHLGSCHILVCYLSGPAGIHCSRCLCRVFPRGNFMAAHRRELHQPHRLKSSAAPISIPTTLSAGIHCSRRVCRLLSTRKADGCRWRELRYLQCQKLFLHFLR